MPNDETLAHPEQPRFLVSAWLWAVALFVFFGLIVAIVFSAMHRGSTYEEERAKVREEKLKTAREEWNTKLNQYGWIDKGNGVAHIPIHRAMELEMAALQTKKPAPAGPIATPAPDAAPAVTETGAAQPANPSAAAPAASVAPAPKAAEGPESEIKGQPAAAANPSNIVPGTQPGANATPAAGPNTKSEVPPVSPTGTPISTPTGKALPPRGAPTPKP
ncbi:MAG: hypothetical protein ACR2G0_00825 [Chthoniobacterales bacterium]